MIKNNILAFIFLIVISNISYSASVKSELSTKYKATSNINNKASLQRGAKQ